MKGFYGIKPRGWPGKRLRVDHGPAVDPYGPKTPDYAQRHRQTETELAPGMLRIDLGQPIPRQSHEPQPITREGPAVPEEEPEEPAAPLVLPSLSRIVAAGVKDWRDDYGLGRDH